MTSLRSHDLLFRKCTTNVCNEFTKKVNWGGREIINLDFFAIFLNLHNTKQQLIR